MKSKKLTLEKQTLKTLVIKTRINAGKFPVLGPTDDPASAPSGLQKNCSLLPSFQPTECAKVSGSGEHKSAVYPA